MSINRLLLLAFFSCIAQIQQATNSLSTLKATHPRLFFTSINEFEQLKTQIAENDFLKVTFDSVKSNADALISKPALTYIVKPNVRYLLQTSRDVLSRSYTLSMMYRLTGEMKYAQRLWTELFTASQFPNWNPNHFLDCAEMTHALAIGYDWLYDVWTPEQRLILKEAILQKGLLRAYMLYDGVNSKQVVDFTKVEHNWNIVCNGGVVIGALAIAEEEPTFCNTIINNALATTPKAMQHFEPEGAWPEGPMYWEYAARYGVWLISALESALGTDNGLSNQKGFSNTGNFLLAMSGPTGKAFNFCDAGEGIVATPILFWFASRYNNPILSLFQQKYSEHTIHDLIQFKTLRKANQLPLDNYYKSLDVVTMRSSWNDPQAWFVGIKAGDNKINHSHLDLGSFVLDAYGERWFIDLGTDGYANPGYFSRTPGGQRWTYYRTRAEGHNTVVINPDLKEDQDVLAHCKILKFDSQPQKVTTIIDLTPAYKKDASSFQRTFVFENRNKLILEDNIQCIKPSELYWFAHTRADVKIMNNGRIAILKMGSKKIEIKITQPHTAFFHVGEAKPLPTSPNPKGINENKGIKRLSIQLSNVTDTKIKVEIK